MREVRLAAAEHKSQVGWSGRGGAVAKKAKQAAEAKQAAQAPRAARARVSCGLEVDITLVASACLPRGSRRGRSSARARRLRGGRERARASAQRGVSAALPSSQVVRLWAPSQEAVPLQASRALAHQAASQEVGARFMRAGGAALRPWAQPNHVLLAVSPSRSSALLLPSFLEHALVCSTVVPEG